MVQERIEFGLVILPLKNPVLSDGLPRMPGGDVRRRGGGELGGDLFDIPPLGELKEEGMSLVFLVKTPAKPVDKKEEHGFIFFLLENALNALGQIGESA